MNSYLLFKDCFPIKGWYRSLIQDNTRNDYNYITQEVVEVLTTQNSVSKINLSKEELDWLIKQEYIFDNINIPKDCFPPINLEWKSPYLVTNVIIKNSSVKLLNRTFRLLSKIKCAYADVIIDSDKELNEIDIQDLKRVKFFIPYNKITTSNNKGYSCIYYNSPKNEQKLNSLFTTKSITAEPINSLEYFSIDLQLFSESQTHHTYFNRKLFIGQNGEIKNAPETKEEFGFIEDIKSIEELKGIIKKAKFQKYWFVSKEICDVCKDCEFRHMCVDNRLPFQRKDGSWYHKQECNYNPYICKWQGEDGYQTLEEIGINVNEDKFLRDEKKIASINIALWE